MLCPLYEGNQQTGETCSQHRLCPGGGCIDELFNCLSPDLSGEVVLMDEWVVECCMSIQSMLNVPRRWLKHF